jgi:hypothetical protein
MTSEKRNCPMSGLNVYGVVKLYPQIYRGDVEKTVRSVSRSSHHE